MRVTNLLVENYKRIEFIEIALSPGVTEISGPNGAGKSSALDAISVWLDGLTVAPAEPIRQGADRARIRGRLGEMYVTRTINRSKSGKLTTAITFQPIEGKAYPATQRQLADLIGEHNLDPLDFLALDTKGKFNAMRAFVPGFDFEKAANEHKADYARRTEVNRIAAEARAAASMIVVPNGTPTDPLDERGLIDELRRAGETNADIERRRGNRERALATIQSTRQMIATTGARIVQATERAQSICDRDVERLEQQIAALQDQIAQTKAAVSAAIEQETEALNKQAAEATAQADELQKKLDEAPSLPDSIDTDALSKRIDEARRINAAVTRAQERAKHLRTAAQYEAESKQLTQAMEAREAAKQQAIAQAQLPVDGIEFGDGEILYRGIPFEQASTAQKLRVAIARIVALNPKLRLAWIRDASLLDDESFEEVKRLAKEYDCDILLETVRAIGKDAIVLENGMVKQTAEAAAAQ